MRIPQPKTYNQRQPIRGPRATQPSTQASTIRSTGPQGTPGGTARPGRRPGGRQPFNFGINIYLWILVAIEIAIMGGFRKYFGRRHHGG